jgi:arylsulfatase A-like enzyme
MVTPSRRDFLATAALSAGPLMSQSRRPNVLFIISDQIHHGALGCAGNPVVKTPNLDRLASEGARFQNAVCATPFCSPTRASFMTGVYPHAHRITQNVGDPDKGLDPKLPTTEQALLESGYTCRQFGKWHLGDRARIPAYKDQPESNYRDREDRPRGKGKEGAGRNGLPVFMTDAVRQANARYDGSGAANTLIGRIELPREKTQESRITDDALGEMEKLAARPFFLTVSLPAPHAPWESGEPYYSRHPRSRIELPANRRAVEPADRATAAWRFGQLLGEEGMREYIGVYYGLVAMMDWNVGRLLDALRRLGLENDTLVVFSADHGDMQGGHGCYDKTTFSMYEETTRVPLALRWPGRIKAGTEVRTQAGSCDLHPTILDYLGMKPRAGVHGTSLRPFIDGKEAPDRPIFCERERGPQNFQRLIRTSEWKYCYAANGASQLYNLVKDPGETKNLIAETSARAAREKLHARLGEWMRETGDRRVIG